MPHAANELKPRQRRRRANLRRILDAAAVMVAEDGFAGLTMGRLAAAVDYTPGALYRYFASKDVIIATLASRVIEDLGAAIRAAIEEAGEPSPLTRVVLALDVYRRFSGDAPHRFALLSKLMAEPQIILPDAAHSQPVMASMIVALGPIADAYREAAESGALRPGDERERALVTFTSVQGTLQMRKRASLAPELLDIERMTGTLIRALLVGWGADEGAVEASIAEVAALGEN